mmetsp:Transcript_32614/g.81107  ORF Transcript_32614/g.81107 Transcript_32614/m.81107 type:complete len:231 (-) Transcript_32614:1258-1950(-)
MGTSWRTGATRATAPLDASKRSSSGAEDAAPAEVSSARANASLGSRASNHPTAVRTRSTGGARETSVTSRTAVVRTRVPSRTPQPPPGGRASVPSRRTSRPSSSGGGRPRAWSRSETRTALLLFPVSNLNSESRHTGRPPSSPHAQGARAPPAVCSCSSTSSLSTRTDGPLPPPPPTADQCLCVLFPALGVMSPIFEFPFSLSDLAVRGVASPDASAAPDPPTAAALFAR